MAQDFISLKDPKYQQFKDHVNSFKKSGYYIVDFVSISDLRAEGMSNEDIADITSEFFDDHEWPIRQDPNIQAPEHWATVDEV